LPDLVLLDGGRGQLHVAQEVFKELNIPGVDLISLAKERGIEGDPSTAPGKTEERVYHPQYKAPLILGRRSPLIHFLDRIRDEAHRFAITHHKKMRGRESLQSVLDEIPGIGPARKKELLKTFGSADQVRQASLEELRRAPKMNPGVAQRVHQFLHPAEE